MRNFGTAERQPVPSEEGELSAVEQQEINIALQAILDSKLHLTQESRTLRVEAEGIILSYGREVLPFLQEKAVQGELDWDTYDYFEDFFNPSFEDDQDSIDTYGESYEDAYSDEVLRAMEAEINEIKRRFASFQETEISNAENGQYTFFDTKGKRNEVYTFSAAIAEYLKQARCQI